MLPDNQDTEKLPRRTLEFPSAPSRTRSLERRDSVGEFATPGDHRSFFIPATVVLCFVGLFLELLENGRGIDPDAPPTEACNLKWAMQGSTFCFASLSTNYMLGPSHEVLLRMGARQRQQIVQDGEVWRLVAPMYLHGGVVHLVLNMVSLIQCGLRLERTHGFLAVGISYLLAGLFGNIMGAALSQQPSVGASGAVFGLCGACIGELVQNWALYPYPCCMLVQYLFGAGLQLVLGTMPMVDNFAHLFGFAMGFVASLSLLVIPRQTRSGLQLGIRNSQIAVQVVATAGIFLAFAAGVMLLYGHEDARDLCQWCGKISCVPFPWGCDPMDRESCWAWDCSACSLGGISAQTSWMGTPENGTVILHCPDVHPTHTDAANITLWPINLLGFDKGSLVALCKDHCSNSYL